MSRIDSKKKKAHNYHLSTVVPASSEEILEGEGGEGKGGGGGEGGGGGGRGEGGADKGGGGERMREEGRG